MSPETEPSRITDPALLGVLQELVSREPIFHREEFGRTRADFENMTVTDFWEVGASGRRYSREYVLDGLEKRYHSGLEKDLCEELAAEEDEHVALLEGELEEITEPRP
jgi:hypothetical protein